MTSNSTKKLAVFIFVVLPSKIMDGWIYLITTIVFVMGTYNSNHSDHNDGDYDNNNDSNNDNSNDNSSNYSNSTTNIN